MDTFTPEERSAIMRKVKSRDTKPEMVVRRLVHRLGYRYRLHRKNLPGKPDLTFGPRHKVIFVHGCFWHRHADCKRATTPTSRTDYWLPKFERTEIRDAANQETLYEAEWQSLVIWECELSDLEALAAHLALGFEEKERVVQLLKRLE